MEENLMHKLSILVAIIGIGLLVGSCAQTHLDKGLDAFDKMAYKKATHHFEKYLAKKQDPEIAAKTAAVYELMKDYKKAAEYYAKALAD